MNGTDIDGITINVIPIEMQDSTDKAYLLEIKDNKKVVSLYISYGQITEINETIRSSK